MNHGTLKVLIGAGIGAVVLIILYVWWQYGAQGIVEVLKKVALWSLIVLAIGLVVGVVIWLFQTKKIDLVAVHRDAIIEACKLNRTPYKQRLCMQAYGDNWAVREIGQVIGICGIHSQPRRHMVKVDGEKKPVPNQKTFDNMIFITYHPPGFLNILFGNKEVIGGTIDDFTTLTADVIFLRGMTFSPKLYGILFLSHHWEQRFLIDETITQNIYRYTLQENLKELATMMEDAIDASPAHKKKQEMQNIQQIPVQSFQQAPR